MSADLKALVEKCTREIAEQLEVKLEGDLEDDTVLFGKEGLFSSIGLVNLVVAVEQAIEDQYDISLSLADQRAMSQRHSPFRSIGALAEYAGRLLEEERA